MAYTIKIGNAVPHVYRDDGVASEFGWIVEDATHHEAPLATAEHDASGRSNSRLPSYVGFHDLCDRHGLAPMFFGEDGLMRQHPGIAPLCGHHLAQIERSIARLRSAHPHAVPRLADKDESTANADLFKLEWYSFWIRWALENCENPAIQNY
jgi:hypothetical protein